LQAEISYKNRIEKAVESYSAKELNKYQPKLKNKSPEQAVACVLDSHFKSAGFFVNRYESKAKNINGVWRSSGVNVGTPDRLGVDRRGRFLAIELKAQGKRKTVSLEQYEFLRKTILCNGFGIVCDSLEYFKKTYEKWLYLSPSEGREFLLSELPQALEKNK
jgi:hypothetical protein